MNRWLSVRTASRPASPDFGLKLGRVDVVRHASEEALERHAMGELGEPDVANLEEHLLVCSRCQSRLRFLDEFVAAMRKAAAGTNMALPARGFSSRKKTGHAR